MAYKHRQFCPHCAYQNSDQQTLNEHIELHNPQTTLDREIEEALNLVFRKGKKVALKALTDLWLNSRQEKVLNDIRRQIDQEIVDAIQPYNFVKHDPKLMHKWLGGQSKYFADKVGYTNLMEILTTVERRRGNE